MNRKKKPFIKRIFSLFLAFCLFLSYIFLFPLTAYADEEYQDTDNTYEADVSNSEAEVVETPVETVPEPEIPKGPPAKIIVHRVSCSCEVYDKDNQLIRTLVVSTGREHHRTPLGNYTIYEHSTSSGYHLMVDGTYGRWCMRFKKGGYMFHSVCYASAKDTEPIKAEVDALGTSVSRGCVRLSIADAEWLYNATPNGCLVSVVDD